MRGMSIGEAVKLRHYRHWLYVQHNLEEFEVLSADADEVVIITDVTMHNDNDADVDAYFAVAVHDEGTTFIKRDVTTNLNYNREIILFPNDALRAKMAVGLGNTCSVWALFYRIPLSFFGEERNERDMFALLKKRV